MLLTLLKHDILVCVHYYNLETLTILGLKFSNLFQLLKYNWRNKTFYMIISTVKTLKCDSHQFFAKIKCFFAEIWFLVLNEAWLIKSKKVSFIFVWCPRGKNKNGLKMISELQDRFYLKNEVGITNWLLKLIMCKTKIEEESQGGGVWKKDSDYFTFV